MYIENQIGQGIEIGNGAAIAHFGTLDPQSLCLTVAAFAGSALVVNDVVERAGAIEQGTHQPAFLPIGVFDTAAPFGELRMVTDLTRSFRKEQGTAKALSAVAVGMPEHEDGMHAQALGAIGCPIGIARDLFVPMRIQGKSSDARPVSDALIDVPEIVGGIGGDVDGVLIQRDDRRLVQRTKIGHVGFMKRERELGQHHVAIDGIGTGGDARAIALRG
jgi:hypothetical protein